MREQRYRVRFLIYEDFLTNFIFYFRSDLSTRFFFFQVRYNLRYEKERIFSGLVLVGG